MRVGGRQQKQGAHLGAAGGIGRHQRRRRIGFFQPFDNGQALSQRLRRCALKRRYRAGRVQRSKRRSVLLTLREVVRALFKGNAFYRQGDAHTVGRQRQPKAVKNDHESSLAARP